MGGLSLKIFDHHLRSKQSFLLSNSEHRKLWIWHSLLRSHLFRNLYPRAMRSEMQSRLDRPSKLRIPEIPDVLISFWWRSLYSFLLINIIHHDLSSPMIPHHPVPSIIYDSSITIDHHWSSLISLTIYHHDWSMIVILLTIPVFCASRPCARTAPVAPASSRRPTRTAATPCAGSLARPRPAVWSHRRSNRSPANSRWEMRCRPGNQGWMQVQMRSKNEDF